jgi:hypothetical protein
MRSESWQVVQVCIAALPARTLWRLEVCSLSDCCGSGPPVRAEGKQSSDQCDGNPGSADCGVVFQRLQAFPLAARGKTDTFSSRQTGTSPSRVVRSSSETKRFSGEGLIRPSSNPCPSRPSSLRRTLPPAGPPWSARTRCRPRRRWRPLSHWLRPCRCLRPQPRQPRHPSPCR